MKIYLASRFSRQDEMRACATQLAQQGHEITSRWIMEDAEAVYEELTADGRKQCAHHDVEDVRRADCLILFSEYEKSRGGKDVEYGIALGLGKPVYIVGPRVNVFHELADRVFETWDEFFSVLKARLDKGTR